jgi:hypothetical protein
MAGSHQLAENTEVVGELNRWRGRHASKRGERWIYQTESGYPITTNPAWRFHPLQLRQRFIEDMRLLGFAPTTQRSYIHYVAGYAQFYNISPEMTRA